MEQLGPYSYQSCPGGFPLGQDTLLLGAFATLSRRGRVCDLGCGCGALPLLLLRRAPDLSVTGVELDPTAAQAARDNLARNHLEGEILTGDLSQSAALLPGFLRAQERPAGRIGWSCTVPWCSSAPPPGGCCATGGALPWSTGPTTCSGLWQP